MKPLGFIPMNCSNHTLLPIMCSNLSSRLPITIMSCWKPNKVGQFICQWPQPLCIIQCETSVFPLYCKETINSPWDLFIIFISKWYLIGSNAASELCLYHIPSVCQTPTPKMERWNDKHIRNIPVSILNLVNLCSI